MAAPTIYAAFAVNEHCDAGLLRKNKVPSRNCYRPLRPCDFDLLPPCPKIMLLLTPPKGEILPPNLKLLRPSNLDIRDGRTNGRTDGRTASTRNAAPYRQGRIMTTLCVTWPTGARSVAHAIAHWFPLRVSKQWVLRQLRRPVVAWLRTTTIILLLLLPSIIFLHVERCCTAHLADSIVPGKLRRRAWRFSLLMRARGAHHDDCSLRMLYSPFLCVSQLIGMNNRDV